MDSNLIELLRCRDAESIDEIKEILDAAGIPYRIGSNTSGFDITSIGSGSDVQEIVSVRAGDYDAARAAMEKVYLGTDLPEDHYLRDSSDDELAEVVGQASLWSAFDVAHARRLLEERGVEPTKIAAKKDARLDQLRTGKQASGYLLFFGWLFTLLGGLIGLGIAWSLCHLKERTPEGEFYTYDAASRGEGRPMLIVASSIVGIEVVLRIWYLVST
ncbi:MAG: hypothetical protein V4819_07360 [Verrucomicrobiota bacterium]